MPPASADFHIQAHGSSFSPPFSGCLHPRTRVNRHTACKPGCARRAAKRRRLPPRTRSATPERDPPRNTLGEARARRPGIRGAEPPPEHNERPPFPLREAAPDTTHLGAPAARPARARREGAESRSAAAPLRARGCTITMGAERRRRGGTAEGMIPTPCPPPPPRARRTPPRGSHPLSPTSHPPRAPPSPSLRRPAGVCDAPPAPPPSGTGPRKGSRGAIRAPVRLAPSSPPAAVARRLRGGAVLKASGRRDATLAPPHLPLPRCPSSPRLGRGGRLFPAPTPPPPAAAAPATARAPPPPPALAPAA